MSNPYPERFTELLAEMPADGKALDCGSGPRVHDDRRVVSFDGHHHAGVIWGDIASLPFDENMFDLILSQAVLEHVRDPEQCLAEMVRVLRPGGHLYIEVPFLQPYHAAPEHYRNYTLQGLRWLCRDLTHVDSRAWGGLSLSVEWIGRAVGAVEIIGEDRWARMLDDLKDIDASIRDDRLELVGYAVCGTFRKP